MKRFLVLAVFVVLRRCRFTPRRRSATRCRFPSRSIAGCRSKRRSPSSAAGTLELRMSRSSPGRYSLHDFAKNVYDVHAFDADGRELPTTRPDPYGWNVSGSRRQRDREVQGVRRSRGRHLSRRRHDARAHQHAGGDHVGARARRSAGDGDVRAAGRHALAGRDAAASRRDAARVHRAEPAVPDGQPVRVRARRRSAQFTVDGRAPSGSRCTTPAPRPSSTATSRTSRRSCARKARSTASIRTYEPGHYTFLADYLPYANGDGMEHRNSTVITSSRFDRGEPRQPARHRRARVLPLLERRAHPAARARAVRLRSRQHVRRAVARRRLHAVLRPAGDRSARSSTISPRAAATFAGLIESVTDGPGHLVRSAEEMSRMAPFIDGGAHHRSHQLVDDGDFVLPVRRRDRAGARSDAARSQRRQDLARRLHARDVEDLRQAWRQPRRATSIIPTRSPTPKRRWPRSAATRRSRATSSRATSRGTRSPTIRGCWRAPASP